MDKCGLVGLFYIVICIVMFVFSLRNLERSSVNERTCSFPNARSLGENTFIAFIIGLTWPAICFVLLFRGLAKLLVLDIHRNE